MVDLERRLSEHGASLERDYPTISLTELSDRLDVVAAIPVPVRPIQPRPKPLKSAPRRRSPRVALAAVMVGLLIAGVAWLTRGTPDGEVIDQPSVTSIPTPTTTPFLSSLTWSRVPYDEAAFGEGFEQVMDSVTVGGPGLVAVGGQSGGAAVWTSPDGITWSRVPHSTAFLGEALMSSVTAGGPGLVAVGEDGDGDAVVWTSADGIAWSRVPHDEAIFGGATMRSVTVGGPGLVAVGLDGHAQSESSNAVVWTSPDGIDWSRIPHNEAIFGGPAYRVGVDGAHVGMSSVTAGGPGLVAVGSDWPHAAVWTSPDGFTWSRVSHDEAMQSASCSPPSGSCFDGAVGLEMSSVTVGGPGLVAVGSDGHPVAENGVVWTSPNGVTWSRIPHNEAVFGGGAEMSSVTVGGPGLVAVGGATVWTSPDGVTWSRIPHNEAVFGGDVEMRSVTAGGPGLVAVGGDGFGSRSGLDAAVWNARVED